MGGKIDGNHAILKNCAQMCRCGYTCAWYSCWALDGVLPFSTYSMVADTLTATTMETAMDNQWNIPYLHPWQHIHRTYHSQKWHGNQLVVSFCKPFPLQMVHCIYLHLLSFGQFLHTKLLLSMLKTRRLCCRWLKPKCISPSNTQINN